MQFTLSRLTAIHLVPQGTLSRLTAIHLVPPKGVVIVPSPPGEGQGEGIKQDKRFSNATT